MRPMKSVIKAGQKKRDDCGKEKKLRERELVINEQNALEFAKATTTAVGYFIPHRDSIN